MRQKNRVYHSAQAGLASSGTALWAHALPGLAVGALLCCPLYCHFGRPLLLLHPTAILASLLPSGPHAPSRADKDDDGCTAAFYAAQFGQVEALRTLADLGCPMAEKDNEGCTAAFLAAKFGQVEALRALADLGCPMAEKATSGRTAVFLAALEGHAGALRT